MTLFSRTTGVSVHHEIADSELPANRVINANRRAGPSVTAQHALFIKATPGQIGKSWATSFGPPRNVDYISMLEHWYLLDDSAMAAHFAHGVAVEHHGEGDRDEAVWSVSSGVLVETWNGSVTPIHPFDDADTDVTSNTVALLNEADPNNSTRTFWVGVRGGQHSGNDTCIMRYNVANKYVPLGDATSRRDASISDERRTFCATASGTGINPVEFDHATKGNCLGQLRINDL